MPKGPGLSPEPPVRTASFAELDAATLYRVLRLRTEVFVVEQACAYPDLDGRDLEPSARHCWIAGDDGSVLAYLRVLREPDGWSRIGRVVTAADARGRGLASVLLRHGLELAGQPVRISAQAHLERWYAGFGFVLAGPGFLEDGIPHVPMSIEDPSTDAVAPTGPGGEPGR